jgi:predicted dinucleotide-utilizing enzyme
VQVTVREHYTGKTVMQASTDAPYMLARLDPGSYDVEATLAGLTLQEPLIVFNGMSSKAAFVWPSNIDFAAAMGLPAAEQQASARIGD